MFQNKKLTLLALSCLISFSGVGLSRLTAGEDAAESSVRAAVMNFVSHLDNLDLDGFVDCFVEDGTMFVPYLAGAHRVNNHDQIAAVVKPKFDMARKKLSGPPYLKLEVLDLRIQMLGDDAAVATWETDRKTHMGRRTAVLHKRAGKWLLASYHASNMELPQEGTN